MIDFLYNIIVELLNYNFDWLIRPIKPFNIRLIDIAIVLSLPALVSISIRSVLRLIVTFFSEIIRQVIVPCFKWIGTSIYKLVQKLLDSGFRKVQDDGLIGDYQYGGSRLSNWIEDMWFRFTELFDRSRTRF